jgi:hypothetical protein
MTGALGRLDGLLRGGGTQGHMCYIILFMLTVFLVIWWFMR